MSPSVAPASPEPELSRLWQHRKHSDDFQRKAFGPVCQIHFILLHLSFLLKSLEALKAMLNRSFVGSGETVRAGLEHFVEETGVDELIVASAIYDHAARLRSYEILSKTVDLKEIRK